MPASFPFSNAIAYAHLQLRGGWKNLGITTLGYVLIVALMIIISLRIDTQRPTTALSTFTSVLLALQLGILVLFGCGTVSSALRTDLTSRMLESHRLMPVSAPAAILGYLLGGSSQVLCMALATFLIGLVTNAGGQTPAILWIAPNVVLASFALFLWITLLFTGFVTRHGAILLFGLAILIFATQGGIVYLLPGLGVLIGPLIGGSIFKRRTISLDVHWPWLVSIASQLVIGAIFYTAAARRFRRPDAPGLGTWLGLGLLAAWVAVSAFGVGYWDEFRPGIWRFDGSDSLTRFLSSMAATMLVALVPVARAARADGQWRRARRTAASPAVRPVWPVLIVVAASVLVLLLTIVAPVYSSYIVQMRVRTGLVVAVFLLTCSYLLRIVYRVNGRGIVIVGIVIVLGWIGPFVADLIRHSMADSYADPMLSRISTCSPLGLLIQVWDRRPLDTRLGLAVQLGLATVAATLFYLPRSAGPKPLSDSSKPL